MWAMVIVHDVVVMVQVPPVLLAACCVKAVVSTLPSSKVPLTRFPPEVPVPMPSVLVPTREVTKSTVPDTFVVFE